MYVTHCLLSWNRQSAGELENPRFYGSLSFNSVKKKQTVLCLMYFPLGLA